MSLPHIERLVPQRAPILVVDGVTDAGEGFVETSFEVRPGNCFVDGEGAMGEAGLMEHIAQSASAMAGCEALARGADTPPVGFIGEVKRFRCLRPARMGEVLHTRVERMAEADGVSLVAGQTLVGDELVAATQMKIYVETNDND